MTAVYKSKRELAYILCECVYLRSAQLAHLNWKVFGDYHID